jgi:hypothetical protein
LERLEAREMLSRAGPAWAELPLAGPPSRDHVAERGSEAAGTPDTRAAQATMAATRIVLPRTGYVSRYAGVMLDDKQCVPAARELGRRLLRRELPYLGADGVAADLWTRELPGWNRIANDGRKLPPAGGALMIWGRGLNGTGHVAFVIGTVNPQTRTVRVVDSNWSLDQRGQIHDVRVAGNVLGWIVPA